MATVTFEGKTASYTECSDNYNNAIGTNKQIDFIVDNIDSYKKSILDLEKSSAARLSSKGNLLSGINSCVSQIKSIINMWDVSYPIMKDENIQEAKLKDAAITEENKSKALKSLKLESKKEETTSE